MAALLRKLIKKRKAKNKIYPKTPQYQTTLLQSGQYEFTKIRILKRRAETNPVIKKRFITHPGIILVFIGK
jgi:hypothetical protein